MAKSFLPAEDLSFGCVREHVNVRVYVYEQMARPTTTFYRSPYEFYKAGSESSDGDQPRRKSGVSKVAGPSLPQNKKGGRRLCASP